MIIGTAGTNTEFWANDQLRLTGYSIYLNSSTTVQVNGQAVVLTNDSRLSDARVASDVYAWAKAATKPSYTYSEVGAAPTAGSSNIVTVGTVTNGTIQGIPYKTAASGGRMELVTTPALNGYYSTGTLAGGVLIGAAGTNMEFWANDQLRLTGGSIYLNSSSTAQINGSTIWHAGNDGTGSGLDADLLDGSHASAFSPVAGSTSLTTLGAYAALIGSKIGGYYPDAVALMVSGASNGAASAIHRIGVSSSSYSPSISLYQGGVVEWNFLIPTGGGGKLQIYNGGTGAVFDIDNSGNAIFKGTVTENGSPSDIKHKKNVKDASFGLATLMQLKPKTYRWDYKENWVLHGKDDIGLIAQEVESVYPFAVAKTVDSAGVASYAIKYDRFIPLLINAVKDLKTQIDALKK
jgi:hypothetical protein